MIFAFLFLTSRERDQSRKCFEFFFFNGWLHLCLRSAQSALSGTIVTVNKRNYYVCSGNTNTNLPAYYINIWQPPFSVENTVESDSTYRHNCVDLCRCHNELSLACSRLMKSEKKNELNVIRAVIFSVFA